MVHVGEAFTCKYIFDNESLLFCDVLFSEFPYRSMFPKAVSFN